MSGGEGLAVSRDEENGLPGFALVERQLRLPRIFDIVNGFFNRCRDASYCQTLVIQMMHYTDVVIWLRLSSAPGVLD